MEMGAEYRTDWNPSALSSSQCLQQYSQVRTSCCRSEQLFQSKNIGAKASGYAYDSDETIKMTEDEIDPAYNVVASNISKR
ncbi:hypothetical protein Syun_011253 [Stephania yunnanensis]|uniref:Uncharacterized protein n=1 Tax=Stephania yunnanensis TaxID=152371 RepID=A0AAP0JX68_9MAGN